MKQMNNKIFTKGEVQEINRRLAGGKNDPTGIFYARIKPKIKELLEVWLPREKKLRKLIKSKNWRKE